MNKTFVCLLIIALSTSNALLAKESMKYSYNIPQLKLTSNSYKIMLDRVLNLDSECIYYTPSLGYTVNMVNKNDSLFITFEGEQNYYIIQKWKNNIGVLVYKKHKFIIYADKNPSCLIKKTKKYISMSVPTKYEISEDDSRSIHYFVIFRGVCYYNGSIRRGLK